MIVAGQRGWGLAVLPWDWQCSAGKEQALLHLVLQSAYLFGLSWDQGQRLLVFWSRSSHVRSNDNLTASSVSP